jgi:HSP20 family molecular chaperone IbpA
MSNELNSLNDFELHIVPNKDNLSGTLTARYKGKTVTFNQVKSVDFNDNYASCGPEEMYRIDCGMWPDPPQKYRFVRLEVFLETTAQDNIICTSRSDFGNAKVNIVETENDYAIDVNVPGFRLNDLKVEVYPNLIGVYSASIEKSPKARAFVVQEFHEQEPFMRQIPVRNINVSGVKASLYNGILKIWAPKQQMSRMVEITTP